MRQHKNTQIGSLMIEMVAVIGLIALITPILFQQIHRRNEEIINTQIATEMRAIKDAMSAFIQANEKTLAAKLEYKPDKPIYDGKQYIDTEGYEGCEDLEEISIGSNISTYFQGNTNILTEYDLMLCYYTVPVNETEKTYRPVIYGVAVQLEGMGSLRRASKIASLIGLEGGVVYEGELKGMQGVWELPISGLDPTAVGVISSFDDASNASLLKDVRWQHMQSDTVQAPIIAAERLGIKDVLTVDNTENCIQNYGTAAVSITATDDTTPCTPFFEVNPETKEVRINGTIRTGTAVSDATCSSTTKTDCEKEANCAWVQASDGTGKCLAEYLLNPAGTSVMEDIKLSSKGGAKLSDLLPKYSLRERYFIHAGDEDTVWTIEDLSLCPKPLKTYATVLPIRERFNPAITDIEMGTDEIEDTNINEKLTNIRETLKSSEIRVLLELSSQTNDVDSLSDDGRRHIDLTGDESNQSVDITIKPQVRKYIANDPDKNWQNDRTNTSVLLEIYCGE